MSDYDDRFDGGQDVAELLAFYALIGVYGGVADTAAVRRQGGKIIFRDGCHRRSRYVVMVPSGLFASADPGLITAAAEKIEFL